MLRPRKSPGLPTLRKLDSGIWYLISKGRRVFIPTTTAEGTPNPTIAVIAWDRPLTEYPDGISMFQVSSGTTGYPSTHGTVITHKSTHTRSGQEFVGKNGGVWRRWPTGNGDVVGDWTPWYRQDAMSGSNTNGSWQIMGDMLICRHILLVSGSANPGTWTYPKAFGANPSVTGSVHSNDGHYATIANRTTTDILVHVRAAGGGASTIDRNVELIAVGAAY